MTNSHVPQSPHEATQSKSDFLVVAGIESAFWFVRPLLMYDGRSKEILCLRIYDHAVDLSCAIDEEFFLQCTETMHLKSSWECACIIVSTTCAMDARLMTIEYGLCTPIEKAYE